MTQPVAPAKRRHAERLMKQGLGRNEIARRLDVSGYTITKIAGQVGHTFDRYETALAVQARVIDLARDRMELARRVLAEAFNVADDFRAPVDVTEFDAERGQFRTFTRGEPTILERQRLAYTLTLLTKAAADLARAEDGAGVTDGVSIVLNLGEQLTRALESPVFANVDPEEGAEG